MPSPHREKGERFPTVVERFGVGPVARSIPCEVFPLFMYPNGSSASLESLFFTSHTDLGLDLLRSQGLCDSWETSTRCLDGSDFHTKHQRPLLHAVRSPSAPMRCFSSISSAQYNEASWKHWASSAFYAVAFLDQTSVFKKMLSFCHIAYTLSSRLASIKPLAQICFTSLVKI